VETIMHDGPNVVPAATAFDQGVARVRAGSLLEAEAKQLYQQLTEDERLGLLDGDTPFWSGLAELGARYNARPYVHGEVARLGIPGIRFVDGPRGCVAGEGTAFPVPMARGATWDITLEERVGEVIGREVRAQGGNFFGGVCINLPRHPAWGRIQETYGDDPHGLGEFGAALTRGVQKHVMACAKHYALNSMENARFKVNVQIAEADLHDIYLPHFKRVADEGVMGIMTSYNAVNGEFAGQNHYLLTQVLRNDWGWPGITVSDFVWGIRDAASSLEAGLDIEEPLAQIRAMHLKPALEAGAASWADVERSGLRALAAQLRYYAARSEAIYNIETMADRDARLLAREVAGRAMVLLRNEAVGDAPVLPLSAKRVGSIALIGRLGDAPNMGDKGSSLVRPPSHVTPIQGLRTAFPDAEIEFVSQDDPQAAAVAASHADVAIIIAGYTDREEGEFVDSSATMSPELMALFPSRPEGLPPRRSSGSLMTDGYGGDRVSVALREVDEAIIAAVAAVNPRTVVAIVAGGAVVMEKWRDQVPAILYMWYAGMEGGMALAELLAGARAPSGRLPFAIPASADDLPFYDRDTSQITYDRFHGQRLLDRRGLTAAFPHGYGLSYTRFEIRGAEVKTIVDTAVTLQVHVANIGEVTGRHIVQVYGRRTDAIDEDGFTLLGFGVVEVEADTSASAGVLVSLLPLARWDPTVRRRVFPEMAAVELEIGSYARDAAAIHLQLG